MFATCPVYMTLRGASPLRIATLLDQQEQDQQDQQGQQAQQDRQHQQQQTMMIHWGQQHRWLHVLQNLQTQQALNKTGAARMLVLDQQLQPKLKQQVTQQQQQQPPCWSCMSSRRMRTGGQPDWTASAEARGKAQCQQLHHANIIWLRH